MVVRISFPPIANNQGMFTTTAGNDLLHDLPAGRSCIITKIMAYNNTAGNRTLTFGTLDRNPAGAAFVQLLPIFVALVGLDNVWTEEQIPPFEFVNDTTATAAGRVGDIYVVSDVLGVDVSLEVVEYGG